MKNLKLLLFTVLISPLTFGQVNINDLERADDLWTKKGTTAPFTGEFIEYFANGKIKGQGEFKEGIVNGLRTTYYENGNKKREMIYSSGVLNGHDKEYYENGKTKQEGEFKNGKLDGTSKIYYDTGTLKAILTFSNGIQHGDYFKYSPEGKLTVQYFYFDGKANYSKEFMEFSKQALELSRQFKNEEAIKFYDKAIEINPTVAQAYFSRGACKANNFHFEGAIKDYDIAIEINPEYMEAYGNRGNAKINTYTTKGNLKPTHEQTESACEDFHKAVSLGDKEIGTADMIYLYCKKKK